MNFFKELIKAVDAGNLLLPVEKAKETACDENLMGNQMMTRTSLLCLETRFSKASRMEGRCSQGELKALQYIFQTFRQPII